MIAGLRKLYEIAKENNVWPGLPIKEQKHGSPSIHDILDRLEVLEPNSSGTINHFEESLRKLEELAAERAQEMSSPVRRTPGSGPNLTTGSQFEDMLSPDYLEPNTFPSEPDFSPMRFPQYSFSQPPSNQSLSGQTSPNTPPNMNPHPPQAFSQALWNLTGQTSRTCSNTPQDMNSYSSQQYPLTPMPQDLSGPTSGSSGASPTTPGSMNLFSSYPFLPTPSSEISSGQTSRTSPVAHSTMDPSVGMFTVAPPSIGTPFSGLSTGTSYLQSNQPSAQPYTSSVLQDTLPQVYGQPMQNNAPAQMYALSMQNGTPAPAYAPPLQTAFSPETVWIPGAQQGILNPKLEDVQEDSSDSDHD